MELNGWIIGCRSQTNGSAPERTDLLTAESATAPERAATIAPDAYRWALDPLQSFGSLLSIAEHLGRAAPAPTDRLTGDPVTNLYLIVCALDQILSDYLHQHFYELGRSWFPGPIRRGLGTASNLGHSLRKAYVHRARRRLLRAEKELSQLSRSLGRQVLDGKTAPTSADAVGIALLAGQRYPARLRRSILKLPQSFRGVDLYPEDCELLAKRAHAMAAADATPVAVVGLRTSGLYMAPLCAAALDRLGRPHVELLSLRPGTPTLLHEERSLRTIAAAGGWALVVDDPTWRGSAFGTTFETLTRLGFEPGRVRLAVCEIGNQPVLMPSTPRALGKLEQGSVWSGFAAAQKVVLGKSEWAIHARLSDEAAEEILNRPQALLRLGASRVTVRQGHPFTDTGEPPAVTGVGVRPRQRRFHAQKVYEIEVERYGTTSVELVVGRGVGLGFFGYHSYVIAEALDGMTPDLLGLDSGVLFTRWETGARPDPESLSSTDVEAIARYIVRRSKTLQLDERIDPPLPETRAAYTGARQVARTLAWTMGGAGLLAQFRAADALSRHVSPRSAMAVDGRMGHAEWVRSKSGDLVKVDFEEHGVDITDRRVNDPVHDVAAAIVGFRLGPASERQLVEAYAHATGDRDRLPARLAYHKLMAGLAALDATTTDGAGAESRAHREAFAGDLVASEECLTRVVNNYLADVYLSNLDNRETGDIWAVDLDDTLETDWLGFQATSTAGARAMSTLAAHDQLVILSTGRSLAEVQDRCDTYGTGGGIAEYGAVAWDARHRRTLDIISDGSRRQLDKLREAILNETQILVDPRYEHSLRLFEQAPGGRRGIKAEQISALIERHSIHGLEVVEGFRKTVVWVAGSDKAHALRPLMDALGVDRAARRLHVVGDEFTDLGLMALADQRHAPRNASAAMRERAADLGVKFAARGRAAGVLQLVQQELHVSRRRCAACREIVLDRADRVLVELLGVQDRSRLARFAYALHPASLRAFEL